MKFCKKKFLCLAGVALFAAAVVAYANREPEVTDPIMLANSEALSRNEEPPVTCFGEGCVDCPNGTKVKYVVSGFCFE